MNLADRASLFLNRGIIEVAGSSSHPQILAWLQRTEKLYPTDTKIDDSVYPWCGVFVGNMVLDDIAAGNIHREGPPKYFQRASAWKKWGIEINMPAAMRGDVVVCKRKGGHHVTIIDEIKTGGAFCVGGNQGNATSRAWFDWSRVENIRRG